MRHKRDWPLRGFGFGRGRMRAGSVVLGLLLALALPAGPAAATYSRVCTSYASCANAGYTNYGYQGAKGTSFWSMAAGNNCTNYVAYRFVKRAYDAVGGKPWSGDGMAYNWGRLNRSKTNSTPAVGAVAWYDSYRSPAGEAGHVAYVERVVSSTEIWVSESNWGGTAGGYIPEFAWTKVTSGSGWPSGFIHFKDERVLATTAPSISGTPKVGVKLTAKPGTWKSSSGITPRATVTYGYQWLANGAVISGATGSTFTPTAAHAGKQIAVTVTARATGYVTGTKTSSATGAVAKGTIANTAAPRITGTPQVGQTLQASAGSWSPSASYSYQWLADGAALPGTTGSTLTLTPAEVARQISVRVTARATGYNDATATSGATAPVAPGTLTPAEQPSISGRAQVGMPLTASTGGWTPLPDAYAYQWFADGQPVAGATEATFTPAAPQVGRALTVLVTASKLGYLESPQTSAPTAVVEKGRLERLTDPALRGRLRVGKTLTAKPGKWAPAPEVTYHWFANGDRIAGKSDTLTLRRAHEGKRIKVEMVLRVPGYESRTVTVRGDEAVHP